MLLKVVSDLHLEFSDINITNEENCDMLVLSGDILVADTLYRYPDATYPSQNTSRTLSTAKLYREFLARCSAAFPHVIYVAGNHEFYHGKWFKTIDILREECAKFPNIHFLEMDSVEVQNVLFVGGTLWTDMNRGDPLTLHVVRDELNDYRVIVNDLLGFTKLRPAHTVDRHRKTLHYIKQVLDNTEPNKKVVVVGHHAPSKLSTKPQYENDTLVNGAYSSDLSEFILEHPQIKLWTHGHTHHPFDYMIGDTRIVCNPRGYEGYEPDTGWDPNKTVEI